MRIISWNVNHRTQRKVIPPQMVEALRLLDPDLLVLTEYVEGPNHQDLLAGLASFGLKHALLSMYRKRQNGVLVASRDTLRLGNIVGPETVADSLPVESFPSNVLHVQLPEHGFDLLGLRIPDYSKAPPKRRGCWDWVQTTADALQVRPSIMIGDFNSDPSYPTWRCGDRLKKIEDTGMRRVKPVEPASYWTPKGKGVCIDHAFLSKHFKSAHASYVCNAGPHVLCGKQAYALSDHAAILLNVDMEKGT